MSRLFDVGNEQRKNEKIRAARAAAKQRVEEVERLMIENGVLDTTATEISQTIAKQVQPIRYQTFRKPGQRWQIEHAQVGDDFVYQVFLLKPSKLNTGEIIALMITAMEIIFPRSVDIYYTPPNEMYQVKFYTIRVAKVASIPGWEAACKERALDALVALDAWPQ